MRESRTEQCDELLTELGMLVGPLRNALDDDPKDAARVAPFLRSRFQEDRRLFENRVREYCQIGDFSFQREAEVICKPFKQLALLFDAIIAFGTSSVSSSQVSFFLRGRLFKVQDREFARLAFRELVADIREGIRSVPRSDEGLLIAPASPFSAYRRLRAECALATTRLDVFEPYLSADVFHRYLRSVDDSVRITLVTDVAIMLATKQKDLTRRDQIVSVSELWATEHPQTYAFYVTNLHDRHIRIDDRILHLGGSLKDAAKAADPFTVSVLEASTTNHQSLDALIQAADEWYGPNRKSHRRF